MKNSSISSRRTLESFRAAESVFRRHGGWSSLFVFLATLLNVGFQLLLARMIARPLGPELFGVVANGTSLAFILANLALLGVPSSSTVLLLRTDETQQKSQLVGAHVVTSAVLGLLLAVLLFFISRHLDVMFTVKVSSIIESCIILLPLAPVGISLASIAPATGSTAAIALSRAGQSVLFAGMVATLLYWEAVTPSCCFAAYLLAHGLLSLFMMAIVRPSIRSLRGGVRQLLQMNGHYGIHQYAALSFGMISEHLIAILLIPTISGTAAFGYYSIAKMIASAPMLVIESALVARAREIGRRGFYTRKEMLATVAGSVFVALIVFVLRNFLIQSVWGREYIVAETLVPYLLVASCFHAFRLPFSAAISGWPDRHYKYIPIVTSIIGITANVCLITTMGLNGAVAALVVHRIAAITLVAIYYTRKRDYWVREAVRDVTEG